MRVQMQKQTVEINGGDDFWLRGVSRGAKFLVGHLFIIQLFQRNGTPSDM